MVISIEPTNIGNEHYVDVSVDGNETNRHGPFLTADAAEAMARRLRQYSRALASFKRG
jgi:hypothetical protein